MAFPRNSLRAFLQYAKRSLAEAAREDRELNIVVGNESADLDSLTSSVLYAYIRSIAPPRNAFSPLYIPLLNIPESGLRLRPEFTVVCARANIAPSSLITLQDLPSQFKQPENIRWILMDHNKLQGSLAERYSKYVQGVIDHHEEENAVPQDTEPEPRIVEKCGSCTSLVARYCRPSWDAISSSSLYSGAAHGQGEAAINDSAVTQGWDAQIAKLALASILVDTANLTAPGKVEAVDGEAVEYLEARINVSPRDAKSWNRDEYYKEMDEAKRNIDSLTFDEILIKDYKEWTESGARLGVSSVVKPLQFLVNKTSAFENDLENFMKDHDLSIFAIMTTSTSTEGEFQRELLVQAKGSSFATAAKFSEQALPEFKLTNLDVEGVSVQEKPASGQFWRKVWLQKDVSKSRKQVAPLLREAMKG